MLVLSRLFVRRVVMISMQLCGQLAGEVQDRTRVVERMQQMAEYQKFGPTFGKIVEIKKKCIKVFFSLSIVFAVCDLSVFRVKKFVSDADARANADSPDVRRREFCECSLVEYYQAAVKVSLEEIRQSLLISPTRGCI